MFPKNSIQVAIKTRPVFDKEKDKTNFCRVTEDSIFLETNQTEEFHFDHVFGAEASNKDVFEKMALHIVHAAVGGFSGTIFAYGQTASGKTYTMMGEGTNPGVMVLAAKQIFKEIEKTNRQFLIRCSFFEIYNEKIYDLLNKSKRQELKIHEVPSGFVKLDCEEVCIHCEEQLLSILERGNKERTVGDTNINERSSRSHAILCMVIESKNMIDTENDSVIQSVLYLVDLAGSERADQTGARGTRLEESGCINKSLFFLSKVIKQLSEAKEEKYISYRDSKLTRILQPSLSGNAFISIICTVNPTTLTETRSTLQFALRAKTVKIKPRVNEIVSDSTMIKRLESEINELKTQLEESRQVPQNVQYITGIEDRLRSYALKIINGPPLAHLQNRALAERRRRTWCVERVRSSADEPRDDQHDVGNAPPFANPDALKNITTDRGGAMPVLNSVQEEHFVDAEDLDFQQFPNTSTRTAEQNIAKRLSISPVGKQEPQYLQSVEKELRSLQEFTNLENQLGVQHKAYEALKQKYEVIMERINELEQERLLLIQTNEELLAKECLVNNESRVRGTQSELDAFQMANNRADTQMAEIKQQLRETSQRLEMENRNFVSLEFELESHRNKAKLREEKLLSVLIEKDNAIERLERQLKLFQIHKLENNKKEFMKLSRRSDSSNDMNLSHPGVKCVTCHQLLDRVTLKHEQLQLDCKGSTTYSQKDTETQLLDTVEISFVRCNEKIHEDDDCEVNSERAVSEYSALKCDHGDMTEKCECLTREAESSHAELQKLRLKFAEHERVWQDQEIALSAIKIDCEALQLKHNQLQAAYEALEQITEKTTTESECHDVANCFVKSCDELKADLDRLQIQYDALQKENEELSTNIMEYLEENENVIKARDAFELKLKELENYRSTVEIERLKWENEKKSLFDTVYELQTQNGNSNSNLTEVNEEKQQLLDAISSFQNQVKELEQRNESLFLSSQNIVQELREEIERLSKELSEKSVVLENCSCIIYQRKYEEDLSEDKTKRAVTNEDLISMLKSNQSNISASSSSSNRTICQTEADITELQAELNKKNELCKQLQLEMLESIDLSETKYHENLREYNEQLMANRLLYEQRIIELEIKLEEKLNTVKMNDDWKFEEKKTAEALPVAKDISTPTLNGRRINTVDLFDMSPLAEDEELGSELEKSREEHTLLLQEWNERMSKLSEKIEEKNAINAQLSETINEKLILLEKRDAEIAALKVFITGVEHGDRQTIAAELTCNAELKQQNVELQDSLNFKETECDEFLAKLAEVERKLQESKSTELQTEKTKLKLECELKQAKNQLAERETMLISLQEQNEDLKKLAEERAKLTETIEGLKAINSEQSFGLQQNLKKINDERREAEDKLETCRMEMDSLEKQLCAMQWCKSEYEAMNEKFKAVTIENVKLSTNVSELQAEVRELKRKIKDSARRDGDHIDQLQEQLRESETMYKAAVVQQQTYCAEAASLQRRLNEVQKVIKRQHQESESQLSELRLKCESLETTNSEYRLKNIELNEHIVLAQQGITECDSLRVTLTKLEVEKHELKLTIETLKQDRMQLQLRLDACDVLHNSLATNERNVTKSANHSLESSTQLLSHRSPNKICSLEDIRAIVQNERKIHRLSTHDESRHQSGALRLLTRDIGVSTDSLAPSCECQELREKLDECEQQLIISNSQVTVLNMRLRHNPLKEENSNLIKRIQEEQANAISMTKRYKSKIFDLQEQVRTLKASPPSVPTAECATLTSPAKNVQQRDTTTQTDTTSLSVLQDKYQDMKTLCRMRGNRIMALQKQIEEKENIAVNAASQQKT